MTPSPVKRYRARSRNRALGNQQRTELREKALEIAEKGLNRRGGPVDKGPVEEQKKAAEKIREGANRQRKVTSHGGAPKAVTKSGEPTKDPTRSFQLHKNTTGNKRSGQLFRTIARKGGEIHEYQSGKRVFVRKPAAARSTGPTGGTGNFAPTRSKADQTNSDLNMQIKDLARRRATENRPKAKRRLFSPSG
jgi:hypothetical protein